MEHECDNCRYKHRDFYKDEPCYTCVDPSREINGDKWEAEPYSKAERLKRLLENQ